MPQPAWIFRHPDQWATAEAPDWADGQGLDNYMQSLGYAFHSQARYSDLVDFLGSWRLYTATTQEAVHAYALLVEDATELFALIWLPALPDLLAYLARYGEDFDELLRIGRLMFRAWHGHSSDAFCQRCDPQQYQRWREKQAERAVRTAAAIAGGAR